MLLTKKSLSLFFKKVKKRKSISHYCICMVIYPKLKK